MAAQVFFHVNRSDALSGAGRPKLLPALALPGMGDDELDRLNRVLPRFISGRESDAWAAALIAPPTRQIWFVERDGSISLRALEGATRTTHEICSEAYRRPPADLGGSDAEIPQIQHYAQLFAGKDRPPASWAPAGGRFKLSNACPTVTLATSALAAFEKALVPDALAALNATGGRRAGTFNLLLSAALRRLQGEQEVVGILLRGRTCQRARTALSRLAQGEALTTVLSELFEVRPASVRRLIAYPWASATASGQIGRETTSETLRRAARALDLATGAGCKIGNAHVAAGIIEVVEKALCRHVGLLPSIIPPETVRAALAYQGSCHPLFERDVRDALRDLKANLVAPLLQHSLRLKASAQEAMIVTELALLGSDPDQVRAMAPAWHSRHDAIRRALEQEFPRLPADRRARWPGLFEHAQVFGSRQIHALSTRQSLQEEGLALGHCVGSYAPETWLLRTHILSLRDLTGRRCSTAEVRLGTNGDRAHLVLIQHAGLANCEPDEQCRQALTAFCNAAAFGEVVIDHRAIAIEKAARERTSALLGDAGYDVAAVGALERAHALYRPLLPRRLRRMSHEAFASYVGMVLGWLRSHRAEPAATVARAAVEMDA